MSENLLEVKNLQVSFHTYAGEVHAVRGVTFHVDYGECMAIVGESGSGKTVTAKAILGLIEPPSGEVKKDSMILFDDKDILKFTDKQWRNYRGNDAAMIFQDPMTSLNPTMKIGRQITESIQMHNRMSKEEAHKRAFNLLEKVNIPNPGDRLNQYPYEFSGGMRQRVVIAIALACSPKLMIADEPTTALDVTIQAQIIKLLKEIQKNNNTSVIMITHDLGIVAGMADYISVMYAGRIVEQGTVFDIFNTPQHPYTYALLKAVPSLKNENKSELRIIPGTPPDLIAPPKGCGFANRCRYCMKVCGQMSPEYTELSGTHKAACWLHHPNARRAFGFDDVREVFEDGR
ncbi:ABC transporter ATP-binding protein [Eubacteriales bacterium mix99]|jgi:oligopeptide transport system ATP-binding protein